jgi:hypothetical protein
MVVMCMRRREGKQARTIVKKSRLRVSARPILADVLSGFCLATRGCVLGRGWRSSTRVSFATNISVSHLLSLYLVPILIILHMSIHSNMEAQPASNMASNEKRSRRISQSSDDSHTAAEYMQMNSSIYSHHADCCTIDLSTASFGSRQTRAKPFLM